MIPSKDTADLGFRRLRYVRYCDDHLLGFAGPKAEAQDIKNRVAAFLRDELNLELSQSKTLITHARTGAARFLGYEITVQHADHKVTGKRRSINGAVGLRGCVNLSWPRCSSFFLGTLAARPPTLAQHHQFPLRDRRVETGHVQAALTRLMTATAFVLATARNPQ